ncbi:NAC domain-containing protein 8 [Striga hermonthica]|uniref:NAC domain-containing protein 8 n=1 Tax=Striga hermonthica TaxID=68872 RepID=A0A9N7RAR5_STRHE|nr:NAC domain-containing protein 8 [Striga hermonthica]
MARAWIVDGRGIAKKVKSAGLPYQINDCGANRQCPNCKHVIDNSDVCVDWPGLPAGVKFDPSDVELLEHLAAKRGIGDAKSHVLIDEFIPTLEGEEGICYTHPENLPGAKKDGTSIHFFYRIINAYSIGQRKRRRIHDQDNIINSHVRWHKTGITKPVTDNGIQKGFKKIMVLYATSKRGSKPSRCHWVMHQFHLGTHKDETEGELVVSKIFYQPQKENDKHEACSVTEECDVATGQVIPKTPMTNTPDPPRPENTPPSDYVPSDYFVQSFVQDKEYLKEPLNYLLLDSRTGNKMGHATCLDGNSEVVDLSRADSLLCDEIIDSYMTWGDLKPNISSSTQASVDVSGSSHQKYGSASCDVSDLDNLLLDTPPDFQLSDLQFPSQDSVFDVLDRL